MIFDLWTKRSKIHSWTVSGTCPRWTAKYAAMEVRKIKDQDFQISDQRSIISDVKVTLEKAITDAHFVNSKLIVEVG